MREAILPFSSQNPEASKIAFAWLLNLRWWAVACQVLLIAVVSVFFDIDVPAPILLAVICFQAGTNLYFHFLQNHKTGIRPGIFAFVMGWDIFHLTLLIYFSGGPMNPFTFLYLVHVALGALLMRQEWAWSLATLTIACYALLFFLPAAPDYDAGLVPTPTLPICMDLGSMALHLQGMWVGYTITAMFIVFFVSKVQKALASHQQTLVRLEEEKVKSEKMASLATLAAGAAHEFSTPLSTITIAAGEMLQNLNEMANNSELIADARLIRREVNRCRDILRQLSADAGEHRGESFSEISLVESLDKVTEDFLSETGKAVQLNMELEDLTIFVPIQTWNNSLKGLLKNAYDADPDGKIEIIVSLQTGFLDIAVKDQGPGMADGTVARATEPFFTTKETGKGLGLGLFLARSLAERFGGGIQIESSSTSGTRITFRTNLYKVTGLEEL